MRWQFWIDVGGTFTDSVAQSPGGELFTCKQLSSGVVKGRVKQLVTPSRLQDSARENVPADFWKGWKLKVVEMEYEVLASDENGVLSLDAELPPTALHASYELVSPEESPLVCVRQILGLKLDEPIPPCDVRLGTTKGTNALLERTGARTALLMTRGFADALLIGNQDRPDLFALDIIKPTPLYEQVIEIDERLAADGTVLQEINSEQVRNQLQLLRDQGIESIAICLLHGYRNPHHEEVIAHIAKEIKQSASSRIDGECLSSDGASTSARQNSRVADSRNVADEHGGGFQNISLSSRVAPVIKLIPRAETTVLDAYLNPILQDYIAQLQTTFSDDSSLRLMTSHGGLVRGDQFSGKDSILSGPAGGVIACAEEAQRAGFAQSIGFDMGGTSTDVSRYGGRYEFEQTATKAGVRIANPLLAIETVAAGGGSICSFDGVQLSVGPASAGASPGPACYGNGGPLTVTDMNLILGRLIPEQFPFSLNKSVVENQLSKLCQQIQRSPLDRTYTIHQLAQGFIDIANEMMVRAIRKISIQKGYDPADHALVSFGGAGGQHACAIANSLGIHTIIVHRFASLFSAYGMGLADVKRSAEKTVLKPLNPELLADLTPLVDDLIAQLKTEILAEGISDQQIQTPLVNLELRYQGTDSSLLIESPDDGDYSTAFENYHQQLYGYRHQNRALEVVAVHCELTGKLPSPLLRRQLSNTTRPVTTTSRECWLNGEAVSLPCHQLSQLSVDAPLAGPALIYDADSTYIVETGWQATLTSLGNIQLTTTDSISISDPANVNGSESADPITLEIFNNQFASIAEQMGFTLQRTSISTNVKERLDFSCAVFDRQGDLVVNAPHIPVHLGAMSETVRCVLRDNPQLFPGDVIVTNDPYAGGSHLPDVTVVTPIFSDENELLFLTASRAHHAEIGGITPGSMPPFSTSLSEEGVLIQNFKLVSAGQLRINELRELLSSGAYPSRSPEENIADINAQIAANRTGEKLLRDLMAQRSQQTTLQYMQHIKRSASFKMRQAIQAIPNGTYQHTDWLDDGSPISVLIIVKDDQVVVDFTGTGPPLKSNLNANRAIVTAAVMYVFRCLIADEIPLNSGVLEPIEIVLPTCLLNPQPHADPQQCAAMVGGNVETSQRVVDVLLGALGVAAASQGTMNNLTFGDDTFGYYETICGGAGATAHQAGADAVHTHMTNTRLTDVEVIEHRYPVRVHEFRIRDNSGGAGRHHGGNGIIRRLEFLRPLTLSLLTQRRGPYPPLGLKGGQPGLLGENILIPKNQPPKNLLAATKLKIQSGDQILIKTPGGGGYSA